MDQYQESDLLEKFADHQFSRQLHVTKHYLRNLILKSLRSYYSQHSSEARLYQILQDIEILYQRDLFQLCLQTINKAEKLALQYQHHWALLQVYSWKRRVQLLRKGATRSRHEIGEILILERKSLQKLRDLNDYWQLTIDISGKFGDENFGNILKDPCLQDLSKASTYRSRIFYYHLQYTVNTILGDSVKAELSLDELINYLESHPEQLSEDPSPYTTALNNKIGLLLNSRRLDEISPILETIRNIPAKYKLRNYDRMAAKLLLRSYNVELEVYRDTGQYDRGVQLIPRVRAFLETHHQHIPMEYHVLLYYQFAHLFFMKKNFSQALADINHILVQRYGGVRNDIIGYAQFLNLIIHYELGNITVMRYAVAATRRFLKKRKKVMEFEKILMNFFSKISTKPSSHHPELFRKLYQKLFGTIPLMDENQLDYLDFKAWINSKIKGRLTSFNQS